jgi:hypothetical protein
VYYNGKIVRRWEMIAPLAATPGVTEETALFHLVTAEIVGSPVVAFDDSGDGGWRTTASGHHIHIDGDGNIDKGNPHVLREAAGKLGKAALGAAKAVGGAGLAAGKAVGAAAIKAGGKLAKRAAWNAKQVGKEAVSSAKEIGKAALRDGMSAADALGETAIRAAGKAGKAGLQLAGRAAKGGLKLAGKTAVGAATGGLKLAGKAVGGAARKIGGGIAGVLKGAFRRVASVKMSAATRAAVFARFAA